MGGGNNTNYGQNGTNIFDQSAGAFGGALDSLSTAASFNPMDMYNNGMLGAAQPGQFLMGDAASAQANNFSGSGAMNQGQDILGSIDPRNQYLERSGENLMGGPGYNPYTVTLGRQDMRNSATSPQMGDAMTLLRNRPGASGDANRGFAGSVGGAAVPRTMNQYLNPYQDQVIDQMTGRIRDQRDEALNQISGQANQAGAFGGARQALLEAQAYEDSARLENETISAAMQSGFQNAAQLGQGQQGLEQNAATGQLNVGGQDVTRYSQLGQLANAQQGAQFRAGQGLANSAIQEGQLDTQRNTALFGAGQGMGNLQLNQGNALVNAGLGFSGNNRANNQTTFEMGSGMTQQQLNALNILGQLGLNTSAQQLNAANMGINAAQVGQGMGNDALAAQAGSGAQIQGMNQGLLDRSAGQFEGYVNRPTDALATALAGITGNPLANAGTTTGTQTTTPGLFDYLSLAAATASSGIGGSSNSGGKG